ncbi:MAG: hypothetical protein ABR611_05990 [Chthoniobacterales bacterium]
MKVGAACRPHSARGFTAVLRIGVTSERGCSRARHRNVLAVNLGEPGPRSIPSQRSLLLWRDNQVWQFAQDNDLRLLATHKKHCPVEQFRILDQRLDESPE